MGATAEAVSFSARYAPLVAVTVTEGRVSWASAGAEMAALVTATAIAWARGLILGNLDIKCSAKREIYRFPIIFKFNDTGVTAPASVADAQPLLVFGRCRGLVDPEDFS